MKKLSEAMKIALAAIELNGMKNTALPAIKKSTLDALLERSLIEYVYRQPMLAATGCDDSDREQAHNFLDSLLAGKGMIVEGFMSSDAWDDMKALIRYEWLVLKTNERHDEIQKGIDDKNATSITTELRGKTAEQIKETGLEGCFSIVLENSHLIEVHGTDGDGHCKIVANDRNAGRKPLPANKKMVRCVGGMVSPEMKKWILGNGWNSVRKAIEFYRKNNEEI